ncbi:bacteriohopanetetrol glucosamine biosynthesis glycosyltransferase HpnI [Enterovirga rhinocerotis]|uniref:Ceramide glucosyltransferase n=1 Tax=Enterovirga rhinocerotis TaxID=1339210 RepID=A0A4V3DYY9_9HYPH|nr:bacteriohopanetetrol glucosamine biosynthesis glycosyltransferase HpnI [Enterovirga rhinocerotis]TDR94489.1 ceramide glucosyltransferase [Enterovirga rhinocerotis]
MNAAAIVVLALAGAGILYLVLACAMVFRLAARRPPEPATWPAVSILKPLHGAEPRLFENLSSFVEQDYPGPVQILFGVQRPGDSAVAIVRRLIEAYPDRDLALVVDERSWGENRKVSNLANLAERARHEVVVLADSDMRVRRDYLRGVVACLAEPGVGAVTCPYHGIALPPLPARFVALGIDTHFLPGVTVSVGLGIGHPCLGSTIALRRETLEAIGGFQAIADSLADDHELGRRIRGQGLAIATTPFSLGHICVQDSAAALLAQELRWSRTIRQIEPAGHVGALLTHPLAFALAAFALAPGPVAGAFVAAALLARLALCIAVERAFRLPPHPYWLIPVRDLLSFFVYAASFLGRSVQWRGRQFDVTRKGALLPRGVTPNTRSDAG